MAIFHLNAKIISRGKGQSAIAAAAYRSGERLQDEQAGEQKFYPVRAKRVLFTDIMAPKNAPAWMHDRGRLWNAVEQAEKRKDAQLAREIEVSLPHELTAEQREYLVKDFAREAFVRRGYTVDIAIHAPDRGDPRNHHAHLMLTMRTHDADGFARTKDRSLNTEEQLGQWREQWAKLANRHLERHGHAARIDHRSLEAQGIEREATTHVGYAAGEIVARGAQSDRMDALSDILERNELRFELKLADEDLALLAIMPDTAPRAGQGNRSPGPSEMAQDLPTDDELKAQAEKIEKFLGHMQWREEQAQSAIDLQQQKGLKARADAFHQAREQEANEARQKAAEHQAAEAKRAQEGDISSASARYAIALGENYAVRDPYASLARAAMSESAMFHRNQEKMREAMAKEPDADKRRVIELRKTIEGCEYMALTSDRLAGISEAVTGRSNSPQAVIDRERAAGYRELAASLRGERSALIEAVQTREKEPAARPEAKMQVTAQAQPARRAAAEPTRPGSVPSIPLAREQAAAPQPARLADLKVEQSKEIAPPAPSRAPAPRSPEPAPAPEQVRGRGMSWTLPPPQPVIVPRDRVTVAERVTPEPIREEPVRPGHPLQRTARETLTPLPPIRVSDGPDRPLVSLDAFMKDNPRAPEQRRTLTMSERINNPELRKAEQQAQFDEIKRGREAEKVVGRIGQALDKGEPVKASDLKGLTREQWDRIGQQGERGLRGLVKEHQQAQTQGRGGRGPRDP